MNSHHDSNIDNDMYETLDEQNSFQTIRGKKIKSYIDELMRGSSYSKSQTSNSQQNTQFGLESNNTQNMGGFSDFEDTQKYSSQNDDYSGFDQDYNPSQQSNQRFGGVYRSYKKSRERSKNSSYAGTPNKANFKKKKSGDVGDSGGMSHVKEISDYYTSHSRQFGYEKSNNFTNYSDDGEIPEELGETEKYSTGDGNGMNNQSRYGDFPVDVESSVNNSMGADAFMANEDLDRSLQIIKKSREVLLSQDDGGHEEIYKEDVIILDKMVKSREGERQADPYSDNNYLKPPSSSNRVQSGNLTSKDLTKRYKMEEVDGSVKFHPTNNQEDHYNHQNFNPQKQKSNFLTSPRIKNQTVYNGPIEGTLVESREEETYNPHRGMRNEPNLSSLESQNRQIYSNLLESIHQAPERFRQSSKMNTREDDVVIMSSSEKKRNNQNQNSYYPSRNEPSEPTREESYPNPYQMETEKSLMPPTGEENIEEVLRKFYFILQNPPKDQENYKNLQTMLYLINFYQNYIKGLKEEQAKLVSEAREAQQNASSNQDFILEKNQFLSEIKELKQTVAKVGIEKEQMAQEIQFLNSKYTEVSKENERIKLECLEVEKRYDESIQKYKIMVEDTNNGYTRAKEDQMDMVEKMSSLKKEAEIKNMENLELKNEIAKYKGMSKGMFEENERLNLEVRSVKNQIGILTKEKEIIAQRAYELELQGNDANRAMAELHSYKEINEKLKKSAENLIDEVCKYKMQVKEMKSKNDFLIEMNSIAKKSDDQLTARIIAMEQQKSNQMSTQPPLPPVSSYDNQYSSFPSTGNNFYKKEDPFSTIYTQDASNLGYNTHQNRFPAKEELPMPQSHGFQAKQAQGQFDLISNKPKYSNDNDNDNAQKRSPKDLMNFPAHKVVEMNKNNIQMLDKQLSEFQEKKKIIESKLCRMPSRPKKMAEKEKKHQLETDLNNVCRKISELKRNLRRFSAF